uniref:Uncharacterized protein n=2 Tax=Cyprinus carpio TaxID=7962 RepID=A0A8C1C0Z1_CYPCA
MLLQRQVLSRAQSSSERIWCRHLLPGEKSRIGKFIQSVIIAQKYVFCLHFILPWLCYAAGLQFNQDPSDLGAEASTLLLPVAVSLINLIVPLLNSLISKIESDLAFIVYFVPRNVILKMSILGILCFYWLNFVPNNISVGALRVHFIMDY